MFNKIDSNIEVNSLSNCHFDSNHSFYYLSNNGIEHISFKKNSRLIIPIANPLSLLILFNENKIWFIENRSNFYVFNILKKIKKEIKNGKYNGNNGKDLAIFYSAIDKNHIFTIWNLITGNALFKIKNPIALRFFGKNLISGSDGVYNLHDINSGKIIWTKNFNKNNQTISRFNLIGEYQNILVVGIDEDKLVGINTLNGEIIWERHSFPMGFQLFNRRLLSLKSALVELDLKTGDRINHFKNTDYWKQVGFEPQRNNFCLVENHILTTDMNKGIIGAFNTQTHQFDWIHEEVGVYFPAGSPMVYHEPYLFVQDHKNTLHIFEKETPQLS